MNIDIKQEINEVIVKKIFNNKIDMIEYLTTLFLKKDIKEPLPKTIPSLFSKIIETWDYTISKDIIREMFKKTDKYERGKNSYKYLNEMIEEWNNLNLGLIEWPFSAMAFDQYIQSVNVKSISETEKDEEVKRNIVRFRRIKKINTFRNDYIEYLMFEHNDNIIPTLGNKRSVDFFINGKNYDQKVSRGVTKEFKEKYSNWREIAIKDISLVAKDMYERQDEERFGAEPRLLIVYLDSDVQSRNIEKIIKEVNLEEPLDITFKYKHKKAGEIEYKTNCYVILLHN